MPNVEFGGGGGEGNTQCLTVGPLKIGIHLLINKKRYYVGWLLSLSLSISLCHIKGKKINIFKNKSYFNPMVPNQAKVGNKPKSAWIERTLIKHWSIDGSSTKKNWSVLESLWTFWIREKDKMYTSSSINQFSF